MPMAIATGSGAEVQRALATVVIGGVVTSTFLTLVCSRRSTSGLRNADGKKMSLLRFKPRKYKAREDESLSAATMWRA